MGKNSSEKFEDKEQSWGVWKRRVWRSSHLAKLQTEYSQLLNVMIDILSNVIINDFDFLIGTLFYIKCTSFV